jgi:hypothetical protein
MSRSARLLALACVPAMLLSVHSAEAAARRARLTVTVSVEGSEGVVGIGSDRTSAKFREGFTLVTYLETDGELAQFDTKDPEYAQKMMGLSQNVHKTVRAAQGKAPVKKMTQEQLQEHVRNKQAACGANQACLMQLAQEAQDLMMNMDTGAAADSTPAAYTGDEPPRFLNYFGFDNCGASGHVYVIAPPRARSATPAGRCHTQCTTPPTITATRLKSASSATRTPWWSIPGTAHSEATVLRSYRRRGVRR